MLAQLVALSGEDAEAEALVLTAPKLSGRLGPVKAAAAGGTSVTSDLLRLHTASPPVHGLRCAWSPTDFITVPSRHHDCCPGSRTCVTTSWPSTCCVKLTWLIRSVAGCANTLRQHVHVQNYCAMHMSRCHEPLSAPYKLIARLVGTDCSGSHCSGSKLASRSPGCRPQAGRTALAEAGSAAYTRSAVALRRR
jgi:hypothetical protein